MDFRQGLGIRQTVVTGKTPAQPALPRMAGNQTTNPRRHNQTLQCDCAGLAGQCLVKERQDGNPGAGVKKVLELLNAKEHGEGEEPGGDETDCDRSHDSDGYHLFRAGHLFRQVRGTIQTCECPVRVDQPHDECYTGVSSLVAPL